MHLKRNASLRASITWLEEHGEPEVRSFKRRGLLRTEKQEVLGLQVPVHDTHRVAVVHHGHDLPAEVGGGSLGVVALGYDAVEELAAGAELHDEIDGVAVLVRALELHYVAVSGQVVHDLDLPADVLHVVAVDELARGYGLAGELLLRLLVSHQVGHAELAPTQLAPEHVGRPDVFEWPAKDAACRGGSAGSGRGLGRRWRRPGMGRPDRDAAVSGSACLVIGLAGVFAGGDTATGAHLRVSPGGFGSGSFLVKQKSTVKWESNLGSPGVNGVGGGVIKASLVRMKTPRMMGLLAGVKLP